LDVILLDSFDPNIGDSFDFLLAGSLLGTFEEYFFPTFSGKTFEVFYGSNFASLTVVSSPVPVPAAFWLFGSAIAGLGFVGRNRR